MRLQLVLRLYLGARGPQNPRDGEATAEIASRLDQRAVGKHRAGYAVPFRKAADPETWEAFADRREEVRSAEAAARVENWIDRVKILVVAPIRVDQAPLQAELPSTVSQDVLEIQAQIRLKDPADVPEMGEIGGDDGAHGQSQFEFFRSVLGSKQGDIERGADF